MVLTRILLIIAHTNCKPHHLKNDSLEFTVDDAYYKKENEDI